MIGRRDVKPIVKHGRRTDTPRGLEQKNALGCGMRSRHGEAQRESKNSFNSHAERIHKANESRASSFSILPSFGCFGL
jgi:hypothetical protein